MGLTHLSPDRIRRPGGRTAEVSRRIQEAVLALLVEGGTKACTFKRVADRAGVERSTLYRRYGDRWEMIIDAAVEVGAREVIPDLEGSFAETLTSVLTKLATFLRSPLGAAFTIAAAELRESGSSELRGYFDRRMSQIDPMIDEAIKRGELAADVDREELFSLAAGPIHFRFFIASRNIETNFIDTIVKRICRLYCCPS